jgi:hypothetical protein
VFFVDCFFSSHYFLTFLSTTTLTAPRHPRKATPDSEMSSKITVALINETLDRYKTLIRDAITRGTIEEVMEAYGAEMVCFFICWYCHTYISVFVEIILFGMQEDMHREGKAGL